MATKIKDGSTKERIIYASRSLFFEEGYTRTTARKISDTVGISTGNLTFHFPTKEHILLELVRDMCRLQWEITLSYVERGEAPLLAYALEITLQTAMCDENEIFHELYVAAYTTQMTLEEIWDWDARKAMKLFADYNPTWTEHEFALAERSASGLELAALMTACDESITMDDKIKGTLDSLMKLYNVPKEERRTTIAQVLEMDYRSLGKQMLERFIEGCTAEV